MQSLQCLPVSSQAKSNCWIVSEPEGTRKSRASGAQAVSTVGALASSTGGFGNVNLPRGSRAENIY